MFVSYTGRVLCSLFFIFSSHDFNPVVVVLKVELE